MGDLGQIAIDMSQALPRFKKYSKGKMPPGEDQ